MKYICDIISPMFLTKYPLIMTSQHSVLMSPHSAYVWHPLHCRWHRIHSITPNNAIYDVTSLHASHHTPISDIAPTVSLSSQRLHWYHTHVWMTKHPPSVWHPMPYIEHHIQSLRHHSTLLMTSQPLYTKAHPVCRATYTLHMRHHIHYIYNIISTKYDITTQCVDDATLSICMTSFALQMTTHPLYHTKSQYLWCHINLRNENKASVLDIAPTVSMSSDRLHWYLTHFCMTSHPPSVWLHMNYI